MQNERDSIAPTRRRRKTADGAANRMNNINIQFIPPDRGAISHESGDEEIDVMDTGSRDNIINPTSKNSPTFGNIFSPMRVSTANNTSISDWSGVVGTSKSPTITTSQYNKKSDIFSSPGALNLN